MKTRSILTLIAVVFSTTFAFSADHNTTYTVDKTKSKVEWKGEKVTGEHNGTVNIKDGMLSMAHGKLVGGRFEIDMTSIKCLDLEDDATNKKLVGHLKSDDFFGVADHPVATLIIKKAVDQGGNKYKITADITIKGITNEITFEATVTENNGTVEAVSEIVIDRSKFNVRYGSGSFFDDLGDKTIYDEFTMKVKLSAKS